MSRLQKIAWFNLAVIAVTAAIASTAIATEIHIRGYSTVGLYFMAPLALLKITPFLFKKPQGQSKVVCDERDNLIKTRAISFASTAFWWVFILSCFLLWLIVGPEKSIPSIALPLMAFGAALFIKAVCSAAILVQYGREQADG